ncbi:MAG: hydrogenase maturation protease [Ktedonobacterales bacterium]
MTQHILIAGIGNIFLGDDGFGSEVAQRLAHQQCPEGVQVVDIGIRGVDLAYMLLDHYDALILVDTVSRGGPPGTLYLIAPELPDGDVEAGGEAGRRAVEAHSMDPVTVLAFARTLGAQPIHTLVVGCEPGPLEEDGDDAMRMGLSAPVWAAVDEAVRMVDRLVRELMFAREPVES